ncbi:hypothetical protein HYX12_00920, partial [Candidatus Woesearchaeota archaeon]|nr:hypothetical protein [Candidatus Woesearchaeota archaeon]
MKITIDTQQDTYEDIKKVLHILTNILDRKGSPETVQENTGVDTTNMMNMFSDGSATPKDTPPDFSSFLNLAKQQEKKKEIP